MSARRTAGPVTQITPALLRRWAMPALDPELGKESRGQVLVVGGSDEVAGAVILGAIGALRAGAGTLQVATSRHVSGSVAVAVPEAKVIGLAADRRGELVAAATPKLLDAALGADAVLVGPGMQAAGTATSLLRACEREPAKGIVVADAGALVAFGAARPPRLRRAVLTPHAGEMARLCGISRDAILARPLEHAREMAARLGVVMALKGACTYVVAPDGRAWRNTAGNLGLGTSGSGDTLSGVIAGLCARGAEPEQAAVWGVYLHARAGDLLARKMGPLGFLARELLTEIPALLAKLGR